MAERKSEGAKDAETTTAEIAGMSFEDAMAALEGIVDQLEGGRVDLEKSITLYERGAALRKHCETKLRAAELKVEQIVADDQGAAASTTPAAAG